MIYLIGFVLLAGVALFVLRAVNRRPAATPAPTNAASGGTTPASPASPADAPAASNPEVTN